ncbi:hypothetical protein GCM10028784_36740 [Myceligenerans cantabricum]
MTEPNSLPIVGPKVKTPNKEQITNEVVELLGIHPVTKSNGSTVVSDTLDRIHAAVTGHPATGMGAYQKTAAILEALGLTYDPHWDTSAGSTVTLRAYSRMLVALSKRPRCFVLNSTDASVGNAWETDKEQHYRYDTNVTGRMPLNDAGPGSLVLFYNTSNHSRNRMSYTATARIEYIAPGWTGPWTADLSGYQEFDNPVPARQVEITGRNNQHAITEITWEQYQEIVAAGTGTRPESHDVDAGLDVGGERAAERVTADFPATDVEILGDEVPVRREDGPLAPSPEREPVYEGGPAGDSSVRIPTGRRSVSDRERDKIVEERAVALATRHLGNLGWKVVADRQKDGVGYDLDLTDGERIMHLEVKGIQGPRLEFNLTAKEWWRVRTDPDFVLAGVTDALNATKVHVNLLSPEDLVDADRVATQYRVVAKGH